MILDLSLTACIHVPAQFFLLFLFYTALACALSCALLVPALIKFFSNELKGPG